MRLPRTMVQNLWSYIPLVFGLLSCAPKSDGLDTLFAINSGLVGNQQFAKHSLLRQVLDGNREIRVCLINEAPGKNAAWLDKVSSGFEAALNTWLAAGSKHPKYPLPTSLNVKFLRYSSEEVLEFTQMDEAKQIELWREAMDFAKWSVKLSDTEFLKSAIQFSKRVNEKTKSLRDRCAPPVVSIVSFSKESSYKDYFEKRDDPLSSFSLAERNQIKKILEDLKDRYIRVTLGSKITKGELVEKERQRKANNDYWLRSRAEFEDPSIYFHQNSPNSAYLSMILLHEVGHLFGLGDVYPEDGYRTALAIHPEAVMNDQQKVGGVLQKDDVAGLHAIITVAKEGIKTCGAGYSEFNNDADPRSVYTYYCLPEGYQPGLTHHGQQRTSPTYGIQSDKTKVPVSESECPTGSEYNQISMLCEKLAGSAIGYPQQGIIKK